tara:strand:- start:169 stop:522 length:354 start_codon:yes stop_codon:yes gene_type:complete
MITTLVCSNIFFLLLCCVTGYYLVKFGRIILEVQDAINESLEELDESYKRVNNILEKPIFFDSVEVRQCIQEIRNVRNVVIKIASRMTSLGNSQDNNTVELQEGDQIVILEREKEDS